MVAVPKLLSITVISSLRRNEPPSLPPSCDRLITALMTFNESEVFTKSKVRTQEKRENWMVSNFRPLKTCLSTVWKYHTFSITQILREIKFRDSESAKHSP